MFILRSYLLLIITVNSFCVNLNIQQLVENCGKIDRNSGLIFSGRAARLNEAPWKAAIFRNQTGMREYICGGSLISEDIIVTAAHCVHEKGEEVSTKSEVLSVVLGVNNLTVDEKHGKVLRDVEKIIIHSGWNPDDIRYDNDITLLKLKSKVQFSVYIQPICLFTENQNLKEDHGKVAGWGTIDDDNNFSDTVKIADLRIIETFDCLKNTPHLVRIIWEDSFCAESNETGVCLGDSGSGLYVEIDSKFYLKGIVSSSLLQDCSEKGTALYSDVSKYYNFIKDNFYIKVLRFNCQFLSLNDDPSSTSFYDCEAILENENLDRIVSEIITNIAPENLEFVMILNIPSGFKTLPKFKKNLLRETFFNLFQANIDLSFNLEKMNELSNFIGNLSSSIKSLDLAKCIITNDTKDVLSKSRKIQYLKLSNCIIHTYQAPNFLDNQNSMKALSFKENIIDDIDPQTFSKLEFVEEILLLRNNLSSLHQDLFKANKNLKILNLNENQIKILPENIFDNLINLKKLGLTSNRIENLDPQLFSKLKLVEEIFLNRNKITSLHGDQFKFNENLMILNLHENEIEILPKNIFENQFKLRELALNTNLIKELNIGIFSNLTSLEKLFLHENKISLLNHDTLKTNLNLNLLNLHSNNIEVLHKDIFVHQVNLRELGLHKNRIKQLHPQIFANLRQLEKLDLNQNNLSSLSYSLFKMNENLKVLNLHDNKIEFLPEQIFENLLHLHQLALSSNQIKQLSSEIFSKLKLLKILFLDQNDLAILHADLFKFNENLEFLNLNENNIETLPEDIFKSLLNLKQLGLNKNQIQVLEPNTFSKLKKLEKLFLHQNKLASIHNDLFKMNTNLEILALNENKIQTLSSNIFDSLKNLKQLGLNTNEINYIHPQTFANLKALKELYLGRNNITSLQVDLFKINQNLEVLSLYKNQIKILPEYIFSSLVKLKRLFLSNNFIEFLPDKIFSKNTELREIALAENKIMKIFVNFKPLSKLELLDLENNCCINSNYFTFKLIELAIDHIEKFCH